ncbi:MAG: biotin--[Spirochaetia bacterium]|nr:biotin--[acetyl-CoA-carboxylase] ligase [Spirochaetia bacterium]
NYNWLDDFQSILYKNGKTLTVLEGLADSGTSVTGTLMGIGEFGQMLIQTSDGTIKEIFTGEIR